MTTEKNPDSHESHAPADTTRACVPWCISLFDTGQAHTPAEVLAHWIRTGVCDDPSGDKHSATLWTRLAELVVPLAPPRLPPVSPAS